MQTKTVTCTSLEKSKPANVHAEIFNKEKTNNAHKNAQPKSFKSSLVQAVLIITVFSVITRALGFGFRVFLSRSLSSESLGLYQIAISVFSIFNCFVTSGLPLSLSRRTAQLKILGRKNEEYSSVTASFILGIILSASAVLIILALKPLLNKIFIDPICYKILLTLAPAIAANAMYSVFRGNLWGHKKYFGVSIAELIEQIARITLCIAGFAFFAGASKAAQINKTLLVGITLTISCIISAVFVAVYYFKSGGRLRSPKGNFKPILKSGTPITLMRVASNLLQPLINIIIPLRLIAAGFEKAQAVSSLGIMMVMVFPLLLLPNALTGSLAVALIPDLSGHAAKGQNETIAKKVKSALNFCMLVSFLAIPVFIGLGVPIGKFLFANELAGIYLKNTAWVMVPLTLSGITGAILNSLGMEAKSFKNYLISSIILFAGCWFLPEVLGVTAFVVSFGTAMGICAILNLRMIEKRINKRLPVIRDCLVLGIFAIICAYIGRFFFGIVSGFKQLQLFITLGTASVLSISAFAILLASFNYLNFRSLAKNFRAVAARKFKRERSPKGERVI